MEKAATTVTTANKQCVVSMCVNDVVNQTVQQQIIV